MLASYLYSAHTADWIGLAIVYFLMACAFQADFIAQLAIAVKIALLEAVDEARDDIRRLEEERRQHDARN